MSIIKKLPKIYQNNIDKKINNNKEVYCSFRQDNNIEVQEKSDISLIIDGIFNNERSVYNIPVIIKTSTKVYDTFLVARTSSYLLTIDQDRINIKDIYSIKRKNP